MRDCKTPHVEYAENHNPTVRRLQTNRSGSQYRSALAVISIVFFMWGFVTVQNDILVPHFKGVFDLNYTRTMLIQFTFFSAYLLVSLPASWIVARIGYHKAIVTGLVVMGCGALLFVPAASILSYPVFLLALWILASGMTLLQVSANPYVAALGPPRGSSSRLNLVQALNSLGTTVGPAVGGFLILSPVTLSAAKMNAMTPAALQVWRLREAASVKLPYLGIAALLFLLAIVIAWFRFPNLIEIEDPDHKEVTDDSIWRHRNLILGAIGIFVYVGAEVAIGSFLVSFLMQPDIGGLTAQSAARYVSFYWGGAMVGRFAGSALLRKVKTGPAVGVAAVIAALLVVIAMASAGSVAMWSLLLVGLFNSIMFPSIFTLGIAGLGKLTAQGSGIMVAAIVGGAIIPLAQGSLADRIGLHHAFFLPVICYLFILYYGFIGSRTPKPNPA
ncbi:MAG TPA: sugar MFS transporter [Bryobacteraceae bacterium]|jgi:FHS family L-fucose permease-like MFS transporter|nr:sugar MFS transporter [Bryobacteraceae bacterium]